MLKEELNNQQKAVGRGQENRQTKEDKISNGKTVKSTEIKGMIEEYKKVRQI